MFHYYFKVNQRNSCYDLGNMNSKLPKINLQSIIGGIFQHIFVKKFLTLVYFDGIHPS